MRSSRSISYWDLGAAGMFDGILCGGARARAGVAPFLAARGGNSQTVSRVRAAVRKCAVFGGLARRVHGCGDRFAIAARRGTW